MRLERPEAPAPPPGLRLRPVGEREWTQVWRRVLADPSVKNVGFAMASFADWETGAHIYPGTELLMLVTGIKGDHTVRNALRQIRDWGLAWRYLEGSKAPFVMTKKGVKKRPSDEYRLTFPDDPSGIPMLSPDLDQDGLALWITVDHRS